MKKVLELEGDIEKAFQALCDYVLKTGGMSAFAAVNQILNAIKLVEEAPKAKE